MNKPRVVKDFEKLGNHVKEQIKLNFPYGFDRHLVTFPNSKGKYESALPFETDDRHYLIRMTKDIARQIIEGDDDYDGDGNLKKSVKAAYKDKYDDMEEEMEEDLDVDEYDGEGAEDESEDPDEIESEMLKD